MSTVYLDKSIEMIESIYWKEELRRISRTIRPVAKPPRWTERAVCTVERDVMIGCFIVRKLIELNKVTDKVAKMKLDVFGTPTKEKVTRLNATDLERNYDWSSEKPETRPAIYICNQCIHSFISFVFRDTNRNWSDLIVVSDFDRNKLIWRIPFRSIITLFDVVSNDYPSAVSMILDPETGDYKITAA